MLRRRYLRELMMKKEVFLEDVVDRIIHTFGMMRNLDEDELKEARESVDTYIETLSFAGETDPQRLMVCGLTYLRNRLEEPSAKFTG